MINNTDLSMTEDTVNGALESFTASTGIPVVLVVEEMEEVFEKTVNSASWVAVILAGIFLLIAVVMIVKSVKRRRQKQDDGYGPNHNDYDRY